MFPTALFITLFLISCSADADTATHISETLRSVSSAEYLVHTTANFGDREVPFTLEYSYRRDGDDRVEVVAPEDVSGISFSVRGDTATLMFDGARLETGRLSDNFPSPLGAVPSLIKVWMDGNFAELVTTEMHGEGAYLAISRIVGDTENTEYRTWFSKDNLHPMYAEIFSDGERIIQCEFERTEHSLQ